METLTYRQLLNFTVAVLYELKLKKKKTGFFSLNQIVKYLNYDTNFDEIKEIARYLDAQGFVKSSYTYGDVYVELTTRGIIHVEESDINILKSLHEYIDNKKDDKEIADVAVTNQSEILLVAKKTLLFEFQQFKLLVERRNTQAQFNDYLQDVKIIISELEKDRPDNEFLNNKANKLLENLTFRDDVSNIVSKLNLD